MKGIYKLTDIDRERKIRIWLNGCVNLVSIQLRKHIEELLKDPKSKLSVDLLIGDSPQEYRTGIIVVLQALDAPESMIRTAKQQLANHIIEIYGRYGLSKKLLMEIDNELIKARFVEGQSALLDIILNKQALRDLLQLLKTGFVTDPAMDAKIVKTLCSYTIQEIANIDAWYGLFRIYIKKSDRFRQFIRVLLSEISSSHAESWEITAVKDNLLPEMNAYDRDHH
jgi:hypothetical protein